MGDPRCDGPACDKRVTAGYVRAESRKIVAQGHLCEEHGAEFFRGYWSPSGPREGETPSRSKYGRVFDPGLVFYHEKPGKQSPTTSICLVENGGVRRVGIGVSWDDGQALVWALQDRDNRGAWTHGSFLEVIGALGGKLMHVVVDRYAPNPSVYEGKLFIEQNGRDVIINVRPSDAIVLATIGVVPIIVSEAILAGLKV